MEEEEEEEVELCMPGSFDFGHHGGGDARETPGAETVDPFDAVGMLGNLWGQGHPALWIPPLPPPFRPSILSTLTVTVTTRPTTLVLFGLVFFRLCPLRVLIVRFVWLVPLTSMSCDIPHISQRPR